MADFHQTGLLATLHRLGKPNLEGLEEELNIYSKRRPIALVLPSLFSELEGAALPKILEELKPIQYLRQVVVSLSRTDEEQFRNARRFFDRLPLKPVLVWNSGPRIQSLYQKLESGGMRIGGDGKGRSCWMAYGYILACGESQVIALHDCDILSYSRELLARLCYPVVNPNLDYEFSKGFYARIADRMYGRVTRLFVTPIIRSLERIVGPHEFLRYLDSFRYPLAGEFCMQVGIARANRIPGDWGLEIGMLAEVYRNTSVKRICQVDLADTYEHKHQDLSGDDPERGLLKMSIDISKILFRTLAARGMELTQGRLKTLQAAYVHLAEDTINRYQGDAWINGLPFDRHAEETAVDAFSRGLRMASDVFYQDPLGIPLIPNWSRVASALPGFLQELKSAVEQDNFEATVATA